MKTLYREGLSRRYGRRMQVTPASTTTSRCRTRPRSSSATRAAPGPPARRETATTSPLIRNFRRHSLAAAALLGTAPAACGSFVAGREHRPGRVGHGHGSTARGDVAAHGEARLPERRRRPRSRRASTICAATPPHCSTPSPNPRPAYETIGTGEGGDAAAAEHGAAADRERVLRDHPAQAHARGGRAAAARALGTRGIGYVEVRCLDVNSVPAGGHRRRRDAPRGHLPAALLARTEPAGFAGGDRGPRAQPAPRVAEAGRDPATKLERAGSTVTPADWGRSILEEAEPVALDAAHGGGALRPRAGAGATRVG